MYVIFSTRFNRLAAFQITPRCNLQLERFEPFTFRYFQHMFGCAFHVPGTNISPRLPWTPAFHHQPPLPFHQDRPWWWEVWSRSNRGWVDRSTNRDVFLFKWPFCMGENGWGGDEIYTVFFFFFSDIYVLNLRLAGYISFTQMESRPDRNWKQQVNCTGHFHCFYAIVRVFWFHWSLFGGGAKSMDLPKLK